MPERLRVPVLLLAAASTAPQGPLQPLHHSTLSFSYKNLLKQNKRFHTEPLITTTDCKKSLPHTA
jgi:hypothetical protein